MPDRVIKGCPYCLDNKLISTIGEIIGKTRDAYLIKLHSPDVAGTCAVIPLPHVVGFENWPGGLMWDVKTLVGAFIDINGPAYNVIVDNGESAGQKTPHTSMLLIPRGARTTPPVSAPRS